jgi:hypothetical protein
MTTAIENQLKSRIERIPAFEDRLGIRLENISVRVSNDTLHIFCEVFPTNGDNISEDISVECVLYDVNGSILSTDSHSLFEESFFGFEVLEYVIYDPQVITSIGKIRIYPKK